MSVYFYGCVTLDGYLADKDGGLGWLYETGTTEETDYADFYQQMDVVVMGRRTFDAIARDGEPGLAYPSTQNFVFTHDTTLRAEGFDILNCDAVDFVGQVRREKNVWIVGGNTILAPLLERGMVDWLILQVAPVLLGAGVPLFTQTENLHRFRLEEVRKYGQFAELRYMKESEKETGIL